MLRLPAFSLLVVQVATPFTRVTAMQVEIVLLSAIKLTLPVGALPVIDALNVTFLRTMTGLVELVRLAAESVNIEILAGTLLAGL